MSDNTDRESELLQPTAERGGRRRTRLSVELRAILLMILLALLLVGAAVYLMWARGAFERTQPLYLVTDDSDGVIVGMDLTFAGFPIGRVRNIELVGAGDVRITVAVAEKDAHWLRASSVFTFERGLVGGARLRAFTGELDAAPLPDGAERILLRGDVSAEIPKMVADVRAVLQNVERLTSAQSELQQTLVSLQRLARKAEEPGGLIAALTGEPADSRKIGDLLQRSNDLLRELTVLTQQAGDRLLGPKSLTADAQASTRELGALLKDLRATTAQVDKVLQQVQGVVTDARGITRNVLDASDDLGELRAEVEASVRRIDSLVRELSSKWPFAPAGKEVTLP